MFQIFFCQPPKKSVCFHVCGGGVVVVVVVGGGDGRPKKKKRFFFAYNEQLIVLGRYEHERRYIRRVCTNERGNKKELGGWVFCCFCLADNDDDGGALTHTHTHNED